MRTSVSDQEGWVILTPENEDIHFVTFDDVVHASDYIRGHVMSERYYEQYVKEREDESSS